MARASAYIGSASVGPGRAEDGDRGADLRHRVEALDELGLDPQRPPRVVSPARRCSAGARGASRPRSRPARRQRPRASPRPCGSPTSGPPDAAAASSRPSGLGCHPGGRRCALAGSSPPCLLAGRLAIWIGQGLGICPRFGLHGRRHALGDHRRRPRRGRDRHRLDGVQGAPRGLSHDVQVGLVRPDRDVVAVAGERQAQQSRVGEQAPRRCRPRRGSDSRGPASRYGRDVGSSSAAAPSRWVNRSSSAGAIGRFLRST